MVHWGLTHPPSPSLDKKLHLKSPALLGLKKVVCMKKSIQPKKTKNLKKNHKIIKKSKILLCKK